MGEVGRSRHTGSKAGLCCRSRSDGMAVAGDLQWIIPLEVGGSFPERIAARVKSAAGTVNS